MTDIQTKTEQVLILGAGELGIEVIASLAALRDAGEPRHISVLLRPAAQVGSSEDELRDRLENMDISIVEADLSTFETGDLANIFRDYTQVIGCTGFVGGPGTQRKITAAAIEARVQHYIPWQFGVDYDVVGLGSGQEVFDEQHEVRTMLRGQGAIAWTIVSTGMFTSFVFLKEFGLVDFLRGRVHALGDWNNRLTVTTPEDIGKLTALIAAEWRHHVDEIVYVAGDTFTYSELADTLEEVTGRTFQRILWTIPELRAAVDANPDDGMLKYRLGFARPDGVAWPKKVTFNAERGIDTISLSQWLTANVEKL